MKKIIIFLFVAAFFTANAQTPNSLGGSIVNKDVDDFTSTVSAQVDSFIIELVDGSLLKVAKPMKVKLSNAAPVGTAIAEMWVDTLGTDTTYFNNNGTWVRFTVGSTATTTLDGAYNNFGATASKITVDAAQGQTGGLEIEASSTNGVIIDLQGTGDFQVQGSGINPRLTVDADNNEVRIGTNTDNGSYQFQVNGNSYFSGNQDWGASIRDNRANTILSQSLSSLATNRILTWGNTTYLMNRMSFKTYQFDPAGLYSSWDADYGWVFQAATASTGYVGTSVFFGTGAAFAGGGSHGGDFLIETGLGDGAGRRGYVGINLGNSVTNDAVSQPTATLDVNGTANFRNSTGIGTTTPDKILGIGNGTDEYSISVQSDRLALWNDASTPAVIGTLDSVGVLRLRNDIVIDSTNNVRIITGTATPEGAVTAGVGSTFHRRNGASGTTLYIKESGTGNTGWVAIASSGSWNGNASTDLDMNQFNIIDGNKATLDSADIDVFMGTTKFNGAMNINGNNINNASQLNGDSCNILNGAFENAPTFNYQNYTATGTLNRELAHYWDGTSDDTLITNTALPDETPFFVKNNDASLLLTVLAGAGHTMNGDGRIYPGEGCWFQKHGTVIERITPFRRDYRADLSPTTDSNGDFTITHNLGTSNVVYFLTPICDACRYSFRRKTTSGITSNTIVIRVYDETTGLALASTSLSCSVMVQRIN